VAGQTLVRKSCDADERPITKLDSSSSLEPQCFIFERSRSSLTLKTYCWFTTSVKAIHPNVYAQEKNYTAALPLQTRALEIVEKAFGSNHPNMAYQLSGMSALLRCLKRYSEAEQLASRALGVAEDRLGPDHPQVALILDNLAAARSEQGRFSEAEPLYRRAIFIQQKSLAPNHPDLAGSFVEYAALLRKMGRKKQASRLEARARNILSANPGDRLGRLTVDVHELERPNSFLPTR